jgi:predicted amidohydrolase
VGGRVLVGGNAGTRGFGADDGIAANLIVDGERIVRVDPSLDPTPSDAEIIDARGLLVMPGMIEMHTHVPSPSALALCCGSFAALRMTTRARPAPGCLIDRFQLV